MFMIAGVPLAPGEALKTVTAVTVPEQRPQDKIRTRPSSTFLDLCRD